MEIENLIKKEREINNTIINEKMQKNFLETTLGKTINTAIDIGIRAVLPEFVEDQVIQIKDNLCHYGLKEGITKTIEDAINLGKSAIGIVTGNFENVSQIKSAVKTGGLIDGMSNLLDTVIDKTKKAGLINSTVGNTIKQGKNIILNNIEKNIEQNLSKQYETIENTNKYINNWKNYFQYKKIEKQLKNIIPIEKTINNAKTIQILHNLIKNNGQDFNLTNEQIELAEKLK